ncbi:MAG: carboxypeptidase regulatory-like domain-containing protein [Gemmatimonadales bacterium]
MLMLLLAAALAVAPHPSHAAPPSPATGVLTGTVTDTSGTPLADVRVHVLEVGRGTTTDVKGKFSLPELPSGTYGVAPASRWRRAPR